MSLRSWRNALVLSSLLVVSSLACSSTQTVVPGAAGDAGGDPASTQPPVTTLFSKSITSVTVEIDYAAGAEPYIGTLKDFGDPWALFNANALAIFDGKKTVAFPRTLAKMEKLDDVTAKTFTTADILAIAAAHRTEAQADNAVAFYVVFLPGTFVDDAGTEQKTTLGVSIGNTGVIGLFKPAIATPVVNPTPPPQLIEQLALIHFLGHAVGFVDNGVPVGDTNKAHIDTADGHHCTNKQCAMSFAIESAAGAAAYAKSFIRSQEAVLIGQECLSDARLLESKQLTQ
ncbi:MAG: Membrane metalloprotease [Myxococcaceae bacterium]|nr:Membrane metalloprotease [Myxococcaceae bacterium]